MVRLPPWVRHCALILLRAVAGSFPAVEAVPQMPICFFSQRMARGGGKEQRELELNLVRW